MADKYILRITAGPGYDPSEHVEIPVNTPQPVSISGDLADIELNVRIQNYNGLPRNSPVTSPYFDQEPHAYNQDQYSICFRFTPKAPTTKRAVGSDGRVEEGISGQDLQFGNDFDRPIRDRLPPGFNTAMGIVRWWIDPGLDGDAYADKPHLYGPALSSFNALNVGPGTFDESMGGILVEEGGDERVREELGMPSDAKARMKWALNDQAKEKWVFGYGQTYALDFFNPYLDFSNFTLRLPGFHLPIMKYWDGQDLRYVLRNKSTGDVYLAVCFTLHLMEDVSQDGTIKEQAEPPDAAQEKASNDDEFGETEAFKEAREKLGPAHGEADTSADDVD